MNRNRSLGDLWWNWVDEAREYPSYIWGLCLLVCLAPFYEALVLSIFEWIGV